MGGAAACCRRLPLPPSLASPASLPAAPHCVAASPPACVTPATTASRNAPRCRLPARTHPAQALCHAGTLPCIVGGALKRQAVRVVPQHAVQVQSLHQAGHRGSTVGSGATASCAAPVSADLIQGLARLWCAP